MDNDRWSPHECHEQHDQGVPSRIYFFATSSQGSLAWSNAPILELIPKFQFLLFRELSGMLVDRVAALDYPKPMPPSFVYFLGSGLNKELKPLKNVRVLGKLLYFCLSVLSKWKHTYPFKLRSTAFQLIRDVWLRIAIPCPSTPQRLSPLNKNW